MKIGTLLHHWRFGPMVVTSIDGSNLSVDINEPSGLVNTIQNKIPKKFDSKYVDLHFFLNSNDVLKSPNIDRRCLHKSYLAQLGKEVFSAVENKKLITEFEVKKGETEKGIENCVSKLISFEKTMIALTKSIESLERDKDAFSKTSAHLDSNLAQIDNEIETIKHLKSPRDVKELLPKLPILEKSRLDLQAEIDIVLQNIESIEIKIKPKLKEKQLLADEIIKVSNYKNSLTEEIEKINLRITSLQDIQNAAYDVHREKRLYTR